MCNPKILIKALLTAIVIFSITDLYANVEMPKFQKLEKLKYKVGSTQIKTYSNHDHTGSVGLSDWDNDGDLDIFTNGGRMNGYVSYYENSGTKSKHDFPKVFSYLKVDDKKIVFPKYG